MTDKFNPGDIVKFVGGCREWLLGGHGQVEYVDRETGRPVVRLWQDFTETFVMLSAPPDGLELVVQAPSFKYGKGERPTYVHDCKKCVFLGGWREVGYDGPDQHYDLYFCPDSDKPPCAGSFIARNYEAPSRALGVRETDDNGEFHISTIDQLAEARRRAREKGLTT